jgi:hypothetical protein
MVQVKAFLDTAAFVSQQAARKAHGGRGIIINAGGPHLLSSAIVTIKVITHSIDKLHVCSVYLVSEYVLLAGRYDTFMQSILCYSTSMQSP